MPTRYGKGIVAGLVGALVIALVQGANVAAGWAPQVNAASLADRAYGGATPAALGWLLHFVFYGLLLGALFALVAPKLRRIGYAMRGVLFGLGTWAFVAFVFMPAIGAGPFGMRLGYAAVPLLLVAHILYGAALGAVFAKLAHRDMALIRPA
jgi:uncharacterized membrane protein YagU involved in acid resistance